MGARGRSESLGPARLVAIALLVLLASPLMAASAFAQEGTDGSVDLNFSRIQIVVWGNGTRFSEFQVDAFAGDSLNVTALVQASRNSLTDAHQAVLRARFEDSALEAVRNETTFMVGPDAPRTQTPPPMNLTLPIDVVDGTYTLRLTLDIGDLESNPVSNEVGVPVIVGIRPVDEEVYSFRPAHLAASLIAVAAVAGAVVFAHRAQSPAAHAARRRRRERVERWTERWVHDPHHVRNKALATAAALVLLVVVLAATGFLVMPTGELLMRRIVIGLLVGALYALVAVGYTMVYGVLKFINFAHGEVFMWGAYAAFLFTIGIGWSFWFSILLAVVFAALLGAAIERVAYRPLRGSARLTPLITAIGVSLFLQGAAQFFFGTPSRAYHEATRRTFIGDASVHELLRRTVFEVAGVPIQGIGVVIMVASLGLMLLLHLFIRRTRMGKAMRAVSDDFDTAAIIGIKVNRVVMTTFMIGSAMAAVAGILYGLRLSLTPTMGFQPGIKAFTAAVVGGIGNVYGAFLGGFLIGLAENIGGAFLDQVALQDAIAFLILIVVLIVRPTGIMASRESEVRKK